MDHACIQRKGDPRYMYMCIKSTDIETWLLGLVFLFASSTLTHIHTDPLNRELLRAVDWETSSLHRPNTSLLHISTSSGVCVCVCVCVCECECVWV